MIANPRTRATCPRPRLTPPQPATWMDPQFSSDGRSVYAVSDYEGDLPRVWRLRDGKWAAITADGDPVEAIALAPDKPSLRFALDAGRADYVLDAPLAEDLRTVLDRLA